MELTSDIDRRAWADDDVDIDLDLAGDNVHDGEDEYMGEEDIDNVTDLVYTSGQDLHACKDDEMADGDYTEQQNDERSSLYDEDIEDAELGGPTIDEDTAVQTLLEKADKVSPKTYDDAEDFSATGITESNFPGRASSCEVSEANLDGVGEVRSEEELEIGSSNHDDDKPERQEASHDNDDTLEGECMFDHGDVDHTVEIIDGKAISQASIEPDESVQVNHPGPSKEEHVAQFDGNEESAASVPEDAQAKPTSETAAYLHPVIVVYQDTEISLFPPLEQGREHTDTYFLHDEQMAGESIKNLLGACRSVLGDSITEQEELVVNIDDLDLHISEVSLQFLF